jgi:enolase
LKTSSDVIGPELLGYYVDDQVTIDNKLLEPTDPFKSKLGANAMLGVSLACARGGG